MMGLENYHRVIVSRKRGLETLSTYYSTPAKSGRQNSDKQTVKFATPMTSPSSISTVEEKKSTPSKPCPGHLGARLAAVSKDGRAYACSHGKECTYRHIPVEGKSIMRLQDIVATMHTHVPNYASWASSPYECTVAEFSWK